MCEANAYWTTEGGEELIMEAVDTIEPEGDDRWHLVGIFGDQKRIQGRIKGMHLVDHKILFEMPAD
jgi:predicted RNA-binding protein